MSNEAPAVTITKTWQGYVVQDPYMPKTMAIAICDDLDEAIEEANDWADGTGMTVKVVN